jgi:hypothetical protein
MLRVLVVQVVVVLLLRISQVQPLYNQHLLVVVSVMLVVRVLYLQTMAQVVEVVQVAPVLMVYKTR